MDQASQRLQDGQDFIPESRALNNDKVEKWVAELEGEGLSKIQLENIAKGDPRGDLEITHFPVQLPEVKAAAQRLVTRMDLEERLAGTTGAPKN